MDILLELLDWNVRGLNDPAKWSVVREFVASLHVNIVCFQETKLEVIDRYLVLDCLGPKFDGFEYLPAAGTRGGILIAWDTSVLDVSNVSLDSFAITGEVCTKDHNRWWITSVYGPQSTEEKIEFLNELSERRSLCPGPWLVVRDFNIILNARDENNDNLDRAMMFVSQHELKDVYLHMRKYTLKEHALYFVC